MRAHATGASSNLSRRSVMRRKALQNRWVRIFFPVGVALFFPVGEALFFPVGEALEPTGNAPQRAFCWKYFGGHVCATDISESSQNYQI
ncbi:MAG: hypothetical protein R3C61_24680 [Bacteroidia bacterium]